MFKRGLLVVLSILLVITSLAGCGSKETSADDVVTLKWMLPSGHYSLEAEAEVEALFNEKLAEELPGIQVELEKVPFSDYAQRYQLALAAKEEIDMVWSGYLLSYVTEATNGSFLALDDLIKEYGQDMYKEIPEWAWKQQSLNGKIYSVPNMQQVVREGKALYFKQDQADKYMDREEMSRKLNANPNMTRESWDALGEYLGKLKKSGEIQKGVSTGTIPSMLGMMREDVLVDNFMILRGDKKPTVVHKYEAPEMKLAFDVMADWYKKGYIVEDVASLESQTMYEFKEDGNVLWAHNYFKGIEDSTKSGGREYVDVMGITTQGPYIQMKASDTSTAIVSYTKHPVEAMKLLNLMNSDKGSELFKLLAYGIEGKHYTLDDANRVVMIRDEKEAPLYKIEHWVLGSVFNGYEMESDPVGWFDYLQNEVQGENVEVSPLLGFKPDVSKLSTELAHIKAVEGEYYRGLCDGALVDHEKTYDEMMKKLKVAGLDKVKKELQSQVDAWLAKNNK